MEIKLLEKENTPENVIQHCKAVCKKAMKIAANFDNADKDLIRKGALLHDIGIIKCNAPSILCMGTANYIEHGVIGAAMLREYGMANGIELEIYAGIAELHTGSGLTAKNIIEQKLPLPHRDFLPETELEKLICYADKFFSKSGSMQEKSLESVRQSMAKFGQQSIDRFEEMHALFNQ
jgi:uncharacterized protein